MTKFPETKNNGPSGALLESMSCGLIPVISNRPGVEFYLKNICDLTIYNNFDEGFIEKVKEAIRSINNDVLKRNLRDVVEKKASWTSTNDLILKLLNGNI